MYFIIKLSLKLNRLMQINLKTCNSRVLCNNMMKFIHSKIILNIPLYKFVTVDRIIMKYILKTITNHSISHHCNNISFIIKNTSQISSFKESSWKPIILNNLKKRKNRRLLDFMDERNWQIKLIYLIKKPNETWGLEEDLMKP